MSYLAHTQKDQEKMLTQIGVSSLSELFSDIPESVRMKRPLNIQGGMAEQEVVNTVSLLAKKNKSVEEYTSYLGAGAYEHYVPSFVDHLLQRSEFYTAYTPYQAEISQGTLQAIYEYQTMVCELTGMDASNASMYDGATALAEAAIMSCDATKRNKVIASKAVHPEYRQVLRTYLSVRGITLVEVDCKNGLTDTSLLSAELNEEVGGVVIQTPNFFGSVEHGEAIAQIVHQHGALMIAVVNPVSLGILKKPGRWGADIVVGEGQPFGNSLNFGGPYLGFLACRDKFIRRMPGRVVGMTTDKDGKRGFVLTLQAREQHIRREKATSNICTNEALCALAFTMHLSALGKQGLAELANLNVQKAHYAAKRISSLPGMKLAFNAPFFHEFVIETELEPSYINQKLLEHKIIGGLELKLFYPELDHHLLFCVTETKSKEDIDNLVARLEGIV